MSIDHEELEQELETLEAIYPDLLSSREKGTGLIAMKVPQHEYVTVRISFPSNYPSKEPPHVLEVIMDSNHHANETFDRKYLIQLFQEVMDSVFHKENVCLFDFFSELDGVLYIEQDEENEANSLQEDHSKLISTDPFEGWFASDPITDRKSTFLGLATHVKSEEEAFMKLDLLKTDPKIRKSHHVMCAWRIKELSNDGKEITFQDSDDDGETAAGSRMLHLISLMDTWGVLVVVVRWFGGIHLGPDRFKHINLTARQAVINAGFQRNTK
ncbi:hypothetical protein TBLA_0I02300 [Henningerozyma blattae CBS 6284]|uniref:RWD domain-containing protein n=1 Tax=Henningerozyma blattae (strain ATCC 34711 / CBS 6284 / DSM 70876 / NBRC 10599 / NRRL Y-10934 / UCD 77-7) TaxID=1071380 RepID=I2H936_HENB6|nr:hypothetical protein TBLA_0I02300 [Tetrapisispora blattae CBS 6284]CCH62888.1 hypothetical protein TBLA_0I02300 [Tetrapisispora blattae CBS 6284]